MVKNLKWYLKWGILVLILILLMCALGIIRHDYSKNDTAARWSEDGDSSHIGVYISKEQNFSVVDVMKFREELKLKLKESDVHISENGMDTWTDCYSSKTSVQISDGSTETEITAYGVGNDFFLFHPLVLVSGSYFTEENSAKDLVLLDEDSAWRFFGSIDIAGMEISINGMTHIISGVIKRDSGMFQKAAGNNETAIYMSYDSLLAMEENLSITSYEVVMPNLTKDYAKKIVKENIKISDDKCEIVECTDRYSFDSLLKVIKNFGKRSMQTKAIIYPYWENSARGIEDVCAVLLLLFMILTGIILVYVIVRMICYYFKNEETIKSRISHKLQKILEMFRKIHSTIFKKDVV